MVLDRIKTIIGSQMGFDCPQDIENVYFVNDLGMDSLDLVELTILVEREFIIHISDSSASDLRSVGDLIKFVEKTTLRQL